MQRITKGDYATFGFTLDNCDGTPHDLRAKTAKFIVKRRKEDDDSTAVLSGEIVHSETNIIQFQFNSLETEAVPEGDYVLALKLYSDDNFNEEVFSDNCKVRSGVCRD